jgi:dihydroorotase
MCPVAPLSTWYPSDAATLLHDFRDWLSIFCIFILNDSSFAQVKRLGSTVAATITVYHLHLTVDDAVGHPHSFCKPIAKFPDDRQALLEVIREGSWYTKKLMRGRR